MASDLDSLAEESGALRRRDGSVLWGSASLRRAFELAAIEDDRRVASEILEHPGADLAELLGDPLDGNAAALAARLGHWRFLGALAERADLARLPAGSLLLYALREAVPAEAAREILQRVPEAAEADYLAGADLLLEASRTYDPELVLLVAAELEPIAEPQSLRKALLLAADRFVSRASGSRLPDQAALACSRMLLLLRSLREMPDRHWASALSPSSASVGALACSRALLSDGADPNALLPHPSSQTPQLPALTTPLLLAIERGHPRVAALLAESGADILARPPGSPSAAEALISKVARGSFAPDPGFGDLLREWSLLRPAKLLPPGPSGAEPRSLPQALREAIAESVDSAASNSPQILAARRAKLEALSLESLSWDAGSPSPAPARAPRRV